VRDTIQVKSPATASRVRSFFWGLVVFRGAHGVIVVVRDSGFSTPRALGLAKGSQERLAGVVSHSAYSHRAAASIEVKLKNPSWCGAGGVVGELYIVDTLNRTWEF